VSQANGDFGHSVALTADGDVVVGAWGEKVNGIDAVGHVYLFDGQTGAMLLDIPHPEPNWAALFGLSIAAFEKHLVVGTLGTEVNGLVYAGAVYVFAIVPEPGSVWLALLPAVVGVFYGRRHRSEIPGARLMKRMMGGPGSVRQKQCERPCAGKWPDWLWWVRREVRANSNRPNGYTTASTTLI